MDVDELRDLAMRYQILSIPCFVAIKNGREVAREVGAICKADMCRRLGL